MSFWTALRKECLEQWRTHRLLVVSVILVIFGLLSPLTARFMPEIIQFAGGGQLSGLNIPPPTVADAVTQYVKNSGQFGVLLVLLLAVGAVAQEKDKGTAALILVKPMPRWAFLLAKFVALALNFALGLTAAAVACYYYTLLLFEPLDIGRWVVLNILLLIFLMVYGALTLFCSTLTKSLPLAGSLALGMLIVLAVGGAVPKLSEYLPAQLPIWGQKLVAGEPSAGWPALAISVSIIIAALTGAWVMLERQEL